MMLHWNWCKTCGIVKKWWERRLEEVKEKALVKILRDFKVQAGKKMEHASPDITVVQTT